MRHRSQILTARNGNRIIDKHKQRLVSTVSEFLKECISKTEIEIKILYDHYEKRWQTYANGQNAQGKIIVLIDSFESSVCVNGLKNLKLNKSRYSEKDYNEFKRIFKILEPDGFIRRLFKK